VVEEVLLRSMSSGELLVLVGALSALGGLGLGASVGAYVTHRLRERAESARANTERDGLLRLISVEAALNRRLLTDDYLDKRSFEFVSANSGRSLHMDIWEQARARLAQLLPTHRLASLSEYYANVQHFNNLLDEHTEGMIRIRDLPGVADTLANDFIPEVRKWIREDYTGPIRTTLPERNPDAEGTEE
jgi:hypothetical protein